MPQESSWIPALHVRAAFVRAEDIDILVLEDPSAGDAARSCLSHHRVRHALTRPLALELVRVGRERKQGATTSL